MKEQDDGQKNSKNVHKSEHTANEDDDEKKKMVRSRITVSTVQRILSLE